MSRLALAFTINNGYTHQLKVVLYSLFKHQRAETQYDIYLLAYNFAQENQKALEELVATHGARNCFTYVPMKQEDYEAIPMVHGWGRETNIRLFLATYLPTNVERVLYLDADTLIMQDLSILAQVDLNHKAVAGALDVSYIDVFARPAWRMQRLAMIESLADTSFVENFYQPSYVNAGILLLNLAYWREHHLTEQAIALLQAIAATPHLPMATPSLGIFHQYIEDRLYPDQDIINYLVIGKERAMGYLPLVYNTMPSIFFHKEFTTSLTAQNTSSDEWMWKCMSDAMVSDACLPRDKVQVIHLAGVHPWQYRDKDHPVSALYLEYAQAVGWHILWEKPKISLLKQIKAKIKWLLPYGLVQRLIKRIER